MGNPPKPNHSHNDLPFPKDFLWGAATSAHQVEGNNIHSDWWEWESQGKLTTDKGEITPRSGVTCNQYEFYRDDFDLVESLGHNTHRLSLEWARIEPEEGKFNEQELDHYKNVLKDLKRRGLKVMLTMQHFTLPKWLADKGGWENLKSPIFFERFVKKVVPQVADFVDLWITINEPGVTMYLGYLVGLHPPKKRDKFKATVVYLNMARAHKKAYKIIHDLVPNSQVGIANNIASFNSFHRHSLLESLWTWGLDNFNNHLFYKLTGIKTHDFLGLNYYFNQYISFNGEKARLPSIVDIVTTKKDVSDLGWEIRPEGLFDVLMDFSDYHLPIYITENGIASTNDDRRVRFLISYLKEIYHALAAGANIKGYYHWSLIDNYEWHNGFNPRFGLIEVDYNSQKRTPRPSAFVYADIIQHNGIPHHLLKLLGHGIHVPDALDIIKDLSCKNCKVQIKEKG